MCRFDFSRFLFVAVSTIVVFGGVFAFGLYSGAERNIAFVAAVLLKQKIETSLALTAREASTLAGVRPRHFLQPARYDGDGVIVNDAGNDMSELILLSGFFEDSNELRLIRRDGGIVARWPVRFHTLFPDTEFMSEPPETDWNVDTHGALALADGSVVFNFEYAGLVKLDRCGRVVWTVERETHHSVEPAEGGGYWVPGRRHYVAGSESPFPPFTPPFAEDTILRISEDGAVLDEISVPKLFYDNGLEAILTAVGETFEHGVGWDREIVHLNKIEELPAEIASDFPGFRAGDLALSLRARNLVMVVDPGTRKIKWWRIGPWLRQHDPEFKPGGTIVLFNNNIYRSQLNADLDTSDPDAPRVSNIIEFDPRSGTNRVLFGGRPDQELMTVVRGKVDLTSGGGLLVTEFEGGRVLETDAAGRVVWEYINRYGADEVAEITEARVYPAEYFAVADWTCDAP